MQQHIHLEDGTLVASPPLEFRGQGVRLRPWRRRDLALAAKHCERVKHPAAAVIAFQGRVIGVWKGTDVDECCYEAKDAALRVFDFNRKRVPIRGASAVVKPFPTKSGLLSLTGCGVDVVFSLERLRSTEVYAEENVIDGWLRRYASDPTSDHYKRLFITYPYKAKEWQ